MFDWTLGSATTVLGILTGLAVLGSILSFGAAAPLAIWLGGATVMVGGWTIIAGAVSLALNGFSLIKNSYELATADTADGLFQNVTEMQQDAGGMLNAGMSIVGGKGSVKSGAGLQNLAKANPKTFGSIRLNQIKAMPGNVWKSMKNAPKKIAKVLKNKGGQLKAYWQKLKNFFKNKKKDGPDLDNASTVPKNTPDTPSTPIRNNQTPDGPGSTKPAPIKDKPKPDSSSSTKPIKDKKPDAGNKKADDVIGKKINDISKAPDGYQFYKRGDKKYIRRTPPKGNKKRLTVGDDGKIIEYRGTKGKDIDTFIGKKIDDISKAPDGYQFYKRGDKKYIRRTPPIGNKKRLTVGDDGKIVEYSVTKGGDRKPRTPSKDNPNIDHSKTTKNPDGSTTYYDKNGNAVTYNKDGYPDFSDYSIETIDDVPGMNGNYPHDSKLANEIAGFDKTPDGYVWHHVENRKTMQLLAKEVHNYFPHTGGASKLKNRMSP